MNKAKILEQLIKDTGMSIKAFSVKCGIPYTTLYTILKNGVGKASMDNILLICKNLGITVEQLCEMDNCDKSDDGFENMKMLIARNGKNMTDEEKMQLITMITNLK